MLEHLTPSEIENLEELLDFLEQYPEDVQKDIIGYLHGGNYAVDAVKRVKNWFSLPTEYNRDSKKVLQKYGNFFIEALQVYRRPIPKAINTLLNGISLGVWNAGMKQYGFDEFFHLSLVATVKTSKTTRKNIIIEKNEVVNISDSYPTKSGTETYPVEMGKKKNKITLSQLLDNAEITIGKEKFFTYNAFTNNCQYFIRYILQSNDLYDRGISEFLFQDISQMIQKLPKYVHKFAKGVTDVAAVGSTFLTGSGINELTWNQFRAHHKGQGYSQKELGKMYRDLKKKEKETKETSASKISIKPSRKTLAQEINHCQEVMERVKKLDSMIQKNLLNL